MSENKLEILPVEVQEESQKEYETIKLRQEVTWQMLQTRKIRKMFGIKLQPKVRTKPKIGRNEPCPCGSGIKFKKCCIKNYD
jgi:uncharacterized protein YecA (UPF0149 family)